MARVAACLGGKGSRVAGAGPRGGGGPGCPGEELLSCSLPIGACMHGKAGSLPSREGRARGGYTAYCKGDEGAGQVPSGASMHYASSLKSFSPPFLSLPFPPSSEAISRRCCSI